MTRFVEINPDEYVNPALVTSLTINDDDETVICMGGTAITTRRPLDEVLAVLTTSEPT